MDVSVVVLEDGNPPSDEFSIFIFSSEINLYNSMNVTFSPSYDLNSGFILAFAGNAVDSEYSFVFIDIIGKFMILCLSMLFPISTI